MQRCDLAHPASGLIARLLLQPPQLGDRAFVLDESGRADLPRVAQELRRGLARAAQQVPVRDVEARLAALVALARRVWCAAAFWTASGVVLPR